MKNLFGVSHSKLNNQESKAQKRRQLELDVKKGSEEAVKRYKGALERLAEYDRI